MPFISPSPVNNYRI